MHKHQTIEEKAINFERTCKSPSSLINIQIESAIRKKAKHENLGLSNAVGKNKMQLQRHKFQRLQHKCTLYKPSYV